MNPIASEFLDRLKDAHRSSSGSLGRLSTWLEQKTLLHGKNFGYRGHEFQRAIIDAQEAVSVVTKPSQVGLSEVSSRYCLGFLATTPGTCAMYAGPTVRWVQTFVKSRMDPVIYESPTLSAMMRPASDSSSFKMIGSSQLHTAGLFGTTQVISIPVDLLLVDELSYCSEESFLSAESRLSHSRFVDESSGRRGLRRFFSTPLADDVGIAAWYNGSDRRKRLCRCRHCSEWFWPDWLENCVVQGFDKPFSDMVAADVISLERRGLVDTAKMICPHCKHDISKSDLGPDYREWVAERPDIKGYSGFYVDVFSVPDYHTPASIMRKLVSFGPDTAGFRNFTLGHPYSDSTNSVLQGIVENNTVVTPITPEQAAFSGVTGTLFGLDVGKTSWVVIAKVIDKKVHILWAESIKLVSPDGKDLVERVLYLLKAYKVIYGICDAYPYTPSIKEIVSRYPAVRAANFTQRDKALPMYVAKDDSQEIAVNRTKLLDYMVGRVNASEVLFPRIEETTLVEAHLRAIRKVDRIKESSGEKVSEWVSGGKDDHYAFATAYMMLAVEVIGDSFTSGFAMVPSLREANVGSKYRPSQAA